VGCACKPGKSKYPSGIRLSFQLWLFGFKCVRFLSKWSRIAPQNSLFESKTPLLNSSNQSRLGTSHFKKMGFEKICRAGGAWTKARVLLRNGTGEF
jgi:hypothetical protein